ncbi:hypothetical protein LEP1GSC021_5014 [Leptospira noguchii str. 1993005606]|uniref:Uncharacterized protein n=2 Tax=Leptospira noguchii TaxID=28182 RepID=M6YI71_9LEPT|nr:hypothetical protein LEP1GSC035_0165 [Leptospira noguchii str. 2007001578]EMO89324.1 hypothetical protein LEP1GSC024_2281 [Leptospira noguchii str. 2001034031]EPE85657.1 hypothetical protein LEP1GSC021_5014 [Leptospira noguchii str. 1993005606]
MASNYKPSNFVLTPKNNRIYEYHKTLESINPKSLENRVGV